MKLMIFFGLIFSVILAHAQEIRVLDPRSAQNFQSQLSNLMSQYATQTQSQNYYETYASELKTLLTIQKQIHEVEAKIKNSKVAAPELQTDLKKLLVSKQATIQLSTVLKKQCANPESCQQLDSTAWIENMLAKSQKAARDYDRDILYTKTLIMQIDPAYLRLANLKAKVDAYSAALDKLDALDAKMAGDTHDTFMSLLFNGITATTITKGFQSDKNQKPAAPNDRNPLTPASGLVFDMIVFGILAVFVTVALGLAGITLSVASIGALAVAAIMIPIAGVVVGIFGGALTESSYQKKYFPEMQDLKKTSEQAKIDLEKQLEEAAQNFEQYKSKLEQKNGIKITLP